MSEHGVVPGNELGLERLGSNNVIIKVDNRRATGDLGVVLVGGTGEALELGISLLMSADNIKGEGEGVVISIIGCKEFIKKIEFIRGLFGKGLATEKVGHDIFGSGKINNVQTIFLNNQPPVVDMIGSEAREGKVLVISVDMDDVA